MFMKMALVQMDVVFGKPEENFLQVEKYIEEAARQGADTIVLPEMWNTGYALNELWAIADDNGKRTKDLLCRLSKMFAVHIVGGSVATNKAGKFFNTMYVVNREGEIVADYDKAHLFPLMDEPRHLEEGQTKNIFQLDGTDCGGVICFDIRFPEWIRTHILSGAKLMFIPAQWPKTRVDHWEVLLKARAIENQCFVIAVNRVGKDLNNEYNGHSMVVSPWGDVYFGGEKSEGVFYVEIELDEVDRVRNTIPIFQARRTDLY